MKKGTGHRLLYATAALISLILLGAAIYYLWYEGQGRATTLLLTPLSYGVKYPAAMLFGFAMMVVSTLYLKKAVMSEKSAIAPDKNLIKRRGLRRLVTAVATLTLLLTLVGCGGGGAGSGGGGVGGLIAGAAYISWTAPITNTDGSPINDLAGYKIYYGITSGVYTISVDIGNTTSTYVTGLTSGVTYYFAITAYDVVDIESDYSNEIVRTIT
jgi:hypothetical protein